MSGKSLYNATKDSDGETILKCLLVPAFRIGGIVLLTIAKMGTLDILLCVFGAIGLSIFIFKNT